jgi:hypothetical protein
MVKFPRRKRASDLDGGRFWHTKIEMRAAQEALDARSETPHALEQTARKAASQSFVSAGLFNPIIVEGNGNVIAKHSILSA